MDFIIYYLAIGYVINNILGLIALYETDGDAEIDMGGFVLTIPIWPYTLYNAIVYMFTKDSE
jgi:hypothetical protein